jgi:MarR family transcriptional regulator, transcriptional regulator for hemolysin
LAASGASASKAAVSGEAATEGRSEIEPIREVRRNIGIRMTVLARLIRNDFDRRVAAISLSRSKWTLIAAVARKPGVNQRAIAEMLEMSEVSAGRLIERLVKEGMVERRPSEGDRRAFCIYLTPAARPVLDQLAEVAREAEEQVFEGMSQDELETLLAGLDKLYGNITKD